MLITRARVRNYKSFLDSQDTITLSDGFNLIIGRNNVGKTALIEALSLQLRSLPHRDLKTVPNKGQDPLQGQTALVSLRLQVAHSELESIIGSRRFLAPANVNRRDPSHEAERFQQWFRSGPLRIDCEWAFDAGQGVQLSAARLVEYEPPGPAPGNQPEGALSLELNSDGTDFQLIDKSTYVRSTWQTQLAPTLARALVPRMYAFKAERPNIGDNPASPNSTLATNAQNLAQVLHSLLSSNPSAWRRYVGYVRTILPHIQEITVPVVQSGVRISLWSVPPDKERDDLAVSINDSGTGVGQVLAILYIAMMSAEPQIVLIDEPQSFLHPGAARKLIELLKAQKHQYILTTHHPGLIPASAPRTILLVTMPEAETVVETLKPDDERHMRSVLDEVGAHYSDVLGADAVIWVEGATEQECFRDIISACAPDLAQKAAILGVRHTADFGKRTAEEAVALYERLVSGPRLWPAAVGFIFDRERLNANDAADVSRRAKGRVHFLKHRMYENYLLNPKAIAAAIASEASITGVGEPEISKWIADHRWDRRYFDNQPVEAADQTEVKWMRDGHGAHLLEDLFSNLLNKTVSYSKTVHGPVLTDWLIANEPSAFKEIEDLLRSILAGT